MIVQALIAVLLLVGADQVHGILAWVACAPLVAALRRAPSARAACGVGIVVTVLSAFGRHGTWLAAAAASYFSLPWPAALGAATVVVLTSTVLPGAVLGVAVHRASRRAGRSLPLVVGALWVAWESLTAAIFPHYPWASLAVTQVNLPLLAQGASLGGQSTLTFAIAAVGASLSAAGEWRSARGRQQLTLGGLLFAALLLYGSARLARPTATATGCMIAAVDAGVVHGEDALARYESLTVEAAAAQPGIIVWPESALSQPIETTAALRQRMQALSATLGIPIIAGGPRFTWDAAWQPRLRNSAFLIADTAALRSYDKRALVPFAEYWPVPFVGRPPWLAADDVIVGDGAEIFDAGACRIGMLICFESERPALTRELRERGANVLLILSNDAQLPPRPIALELAYAQLRALETGLAVVRAANRGVTAVIDPFGRVIARGETAIVTAAIHTAAPPLAVTMAPIFLAICWVATGAAMAGSVLTTLSESA